MTPIIILVRPQLGENIGMCARAMRNFSLSQMRIVAPRDGWPNPSAYSAAKGADEILDNALIFDDLPNACADIHYLYATTARQRDMNLDFTSPQNCIDDIIAQYQSEPQHIAIMFGAERSGLHNDEIALSDCAISFPTAPDFASLNLAQSVGLIAYEWAKKQYQTPNHNINDNDDMPASPAMINRFCDELDDDLSNSEFYKSPDKRERLRLNITRLIKRMRPSLHDINLLYGIKRALNKEKNNNN